MLLNIMPQMLFDGLFMNLNSVPPGFVWLKTISIFRLGFEERAESAEVARCRKKSRWKERLSCAAHIVLLLGLTCNPKMAISNCNIIFSGLGTGMMYVILISHSSTIFPNLGSAKFPQSATVPHDQALMINQWQDYGALDCSKELTCYAADGEAVLNVNGIDPAASAWVKSLAFNINPGDLLNRLLKTWFSLMFTVKT